MMDCAECHGRCPHGICARSANGCSCVNPEPNTPGPAGAGLATTIFTLLCIFALFVAVLVTCDFSAIGTEPLAFLTPAQNDAEQEEAEEENPGEESEEPPEIEKVM